MLNKKLYISLLLACGFMFSGHAQETVPLDTVIDVRNADLIVSQDEQGLHIEVNGQEGEDNFFYPYLVNTTYATQRTYTNPATIFHNNNFSISASGFSIGFVKALDAPAGMQQEMGKSLEISLDQIVSFQWKMSSKRDILAVGIGVDWRNYRMTGVNRFVCDNNVVVIEPWGDGQYPVDSRLKTFSIQVPLSYVHNFSNFVKAGVAVILNANTYGSLKGHFLNEAGEKVQTFRGCTGEINKFTVDFKATVQFCPFVALYCKYSPMNVFRNGHGPKFTPLSAGFTFFY